MRTQERECCLVDIWNLFVDVVWVVSIFDHHMLSSQSHTFIIYIYFIFDFFFMFGLDFNMKYLDFFIFFWLTLGFLKLDSKKFESSYLFIETTLIEIL